MKFHSILIIAILFSSSAFAAKGVVLPESEIYRVNAVVCGKLNGNFLSGKILKSGRFDSYKKQIAVLNNLIRNTSGTAKNKALKKRRNIKAKKIAADPTCIALKNNTTLPNATTYESSTSFSSLDIETLDTILIGYCPANLELSSVWGNFIYTHDSSICTAAIHAGMITTSGGNVIAKLKPGLESYPSITRNGITTSSWGSWSFSFVFLSLNNYQEVLG